MALWWHLEFYVCTSHCTWKVIKKLETFYNSCIKSHKRTLLLIKMFCVWNGWGCLRSVFESHNPIKLHFNVECSPTPYDTSKWKEFELVEYIMQQRTHFMLFPVCSVYELDTDTTLCLAISLSYFFLREHWNEVKQKWHMTLTFYHSLNHEYLMNL